MIKKKRRCQHCGNKAKWPKSAPIFCTMKSAADFGLIVATSSEVELEPGLFCNECGLKKHHKVCSHFKEYQRCPETGAPVAFYPNRTDWVCGSCGLNCQDKTVGQCSSIKT